MDGTLEYGIRSNTIMVVGDSSRPLSPHWPPLQRQLPLLIWLTNIILPITLHVLLRLLLPLNLLRLRIPPTMKRNTKKGIIISCSLS
jgi:hypothetical protein